MQDVALTGALTEPEFAELVDALAGDPDRRAQLTDLLREDHPLYDQRGTATTVRMRGWVLLALARAGVPDTALLFVLEELDTGTDPYLVAAAARALRSYPNPTAAFAPFVMRSLTNIRYHDEPVSFENYGEYAVASTGTSAVRELLATLAWLGPYARGVLDEVETLRSPDEGLGRKLLVDIDQAVESIRGDDQGTAPGAEEDCCALPGGLTNTFSWAFGSRRDCQPIEQTVFEDHDGNSNTFKELFQGHPSIVVFFYTRCDNPLKCSLTVTKLARIQKLLETQGLADKIHTAAITYDPAYDLPRRLRGYGHDRGVRLDSRNRMLRATDGIDTLRRYFKLGVNFIESLVNRHRLEVYILDADGRIAASFQRIHWDEQQVVTRAAKLLSEPPALAGGPYEQAGLAGGPYEQAALAGGPYPLKLTGYGREATPAAPQPDKRWNTAPVFSTLASLGLAFFPKCPVCWAGYMSMFGVASLGQVPYSPWLQPVLVIVMLINLASVWIRGRSTGRMSPFYLVSVGALAIVMSKRGPGLEKVAVWGVAFTFAGSMLSALSATKGRRPVTDLLAQIWQKRFSLFRPSR
jgi:protein SCO1/2